MMFDFYQLDTVEQRLQFLDDTFTPIVVAAITEYQHRQRLPGKVTKDISFDISSGYGANYELVDIPICVIRVMLYSDPRYFMQPYYWVHRYRPHNVNGFSSGLTREDLLNTLQHL